jgi:hypothetical protein
MKVSVGVAMYSFMYPATHTQAPLHHLYPELHSL